MERLPASRDSQSPAPIKEEDGDLTRTTSSSLTPLRSSQKPKTAKARHYEDLSDEDIDPFTEEMMPEIVTRAQMQAEKERFPGSKTWAEDEERLYELLFLRQDLPILPAHWEVDFRGVPISGTNFALEDEQTPLVYAHAKEFLATTALIRLIDLTSDVRTKTQAGRRFRAPSIIKKGLDQFLSWAAEDGGFFHKKVVPNIITEVIDTAESEENIKTDDPEDDTMKALNEEISAFVLSRMRALSKLQREFYRSDRDPDFWSLGHRGARRGDEEDSSMQSLLLQKYFSSLVKRTLRHSESADELSKAATNTQRAPHPATPSIKRQRTVQSPITEIDELAESSTSPTHLGQTTPPGAIRSETQDGYLTPSRRKLNASELTYRRRPPVVYGLFVLSSSVLVLTADSSQGDDCYVSFHVEVDFTNKRQCVWNALTIAIVACMARDDLRNRLADFEEPVNGANDSDPDV